MVDTIKITGRKGKTCMPAEVEVEPAEVEVEPAEVEVDVVVEIVATISLN